MLKEVYSTHTIAPCHKICITENCKMKNKCLVPLLSDISRNGKGNRRTHFSLCHVLFCNVCGHDRSTLLFIFYAKYSVEKTWAALHLLACFLSFIQFFGKNISCFHKLAVSLFFFFSPLPANVKHVQIWIYSVAKLYDSGHFMEAEKTPHILPVYSLAIFRLPFCDALSSSLLFRFVWTV